MAPFLLVAALALAAGAPNAARIDYAGPAGLRWGMTPEAVHAELDKRFTFVSEHEADHGMSLVREYSGSFAGFETDRIEAIFSGGKLLALAVVLQDEDERPASKRWEQILEQMAVAYGPPAKRSGAPPIHKADPRPASVLYMAAEESAYLALDRKIVAGDYSPDARWLFKNKAQIVASVRVDKPDENGVRALHVVWIFAGPGAEAWSAAADAATPRDY